MIGHRHHLNLTKLEVTKVATKPIHWSDGFCILLNGYDIILLYYACALSLHG